MSPATREIRLLEIDIECDLCDGKGNADAPHLVAKVQPCIACIRTPGTRHLKLRIPAKGDLVRVKSQSLLESLFGEDDAPEDPGRVYDTQMPEEHHMELTTGFGVRVTWDRLNTKGEIPKGEQVTLWLFDLLELEVVG